MTDLIFSEKELRVIGNYYKHLWFVIWKIKEMVNDYMVHRKKFEIKGREASPHQMTFILWAFYLARENRGLKYDSKVEFFWREEISSKTVRDEIKRTEEFLRLISGRRENRPEAVEKFLSIAKK